MRLRQGNIRLDIRKRLFTRRAGSHWNRVPREVFTAPILSEFIQHLDDALSCGIVLGSAVRSKKLELMMLMGPFQLQILLWLCDSGCC